MKLCFGSMKMPCSNGRGNSLQLISSAKSVLCTASSKSGAIKKKGHAPVDHQLERGHEPAGGSIDTIQAIANALGDDIPQECRALSRRPIPACRLIDARIELRQQFRV